jgi:D-glucuronyl C5-epimerase C-terminus
MPAASPSAPAPRVVAVFAALTAGAALLGWAGASRLLDRAPPLSPAPAPAPPAPARPAPTPPAPRAAAPPARPSAPAPRRAAPSRSASEAPRARPAPPRPAAPARHPPARTRPRAPAPRPVPAPRRAPAPRPAPTLPQTRGAPSAAAPAPSAAPEVGSAAPPPAFVVPAADLPTGVDAARAVLAERLAGAPEGSRMRQDLAWLLELARRDGPGAEDVPEGRASTVARALRANAWWYASRGSPEQRVLLRDPDGVILTYREGHGFAVNTVATSGRWRGLNEDLPPEALAAPLLEMAVSRRVDGRRMLTWEYFDDPDDPAAVRPGVSGMAQARMSELLAHAWRRTGDPRFAEASRDALTALSVDVEGGGAMSRVAGTAGGETSPWYVERAYPGASPWKGAALNGFMVTLLSLRGAADVLSRPPDVGGPEPPVAAPEPGPEAPASAPPPPDGGASVASESPAAPSGDAAAAGAALARGLAERGAGTLRRLLPLFDSGAWSYYGLLTPGHEWRTDLADLNYHCYHVALLERLAGRWPGDGFAAVAERWAGYVARVGATCPER